MKKITILILLAGVFGLGVKAQTTVEQSLAQNLAIEQGEQAVPQPNVVTQITAIKAAGELATLPHEISWEEFQTLSFTGAICSNIIVAKDQPGQTPCAIMESLNIVAPIVEQLLASGQTPEEILQNIVSVAPGFVAERVFENLEDTSGQVFTYYLALSVFDQAQHAIVYKFVELHASLFQEEEQVEELASGVTEQEIEALVIFPNPAQTSIQINDVAIGSDIAIYNASGQMMYQNNTTDTNVLVDVSNFSQGMYLITLQMKDGTLRKGKFQKVW